ncbi:hypothetical protein CDD81_3633 [Ophiocordyceps australis]|uniref:Imidazoleglycerol-phosphate dehydratase n=1 Tax=Ophiocordyceps australis TaxID=1399860 RepID=A0A2C5YBB3_9HYPO|nr:hypothetical protein CDD81_3633 [Ophiocordyceps australis]
MRAHDAMKSAEANDAAWEAGRGAVLGAAKWGVGAAILGAFGYALSPIYRATTVQFKVYIQMSGMLLGSMIEADWRLRQFEQQVRLQKRGLRDRARWEQYEEELAAYEKRSK